MEPTNVSTVSRALKAAVDFVLPITCAHCGVEGAHLCGDCIDRAPSTLGNGCSKCGERTAEFLNLCGDCVTLPPPLDRLIPTFRYGGSARSAVLALKYRNITEIAPVMAREMAKTSFFQRASIDAVVPIPMHSGRLRERGYNQASLLAQAVADNLGFRFIADALTKTRATRSQVELTRQERSMSLRGVIESQYDFSGAHVLLVDDVCTTGSTLMNGAAALKVAGAKRVSGVVFAKEMLDAIDEESRQ